MRIFFLLVLSLLVSRANAAESLIERPVRKMAVSEDMLFAAFVTSDTLSVFDLDKRAALFVMPLDDAKLLSLSISRVGNRIAWADDQGLVHLLSLQTGEDHGSLRPFEQGNATALSFSSDGRMLAAGSDQGELSVRIARNSADRAKFKPHEGAVREIGWVTGEPQLVSLGADGRLKLTNLITTEQTNIGESRTTPTLSLSLSGSAGNYFTSEADGTFLVRVLTDHDAAFALPLAPVPGALVRSSSDNVWIAMIPADSPPTYVRMANGNKILGEDPVVDVGFSTELGCVIEAGEFGARLMRFAPPVPKEEPHDPSGDHTGHNH